MKNLKLFEEWRHSHPLDFGDYKITFNNDTSRSRNTLYSFSVNVDFSEDVGEKSWWEVYTNLPPSQTNPIEIHYNNSIKSDITHISKEELYKNILEIFNKEIENFELNDRYNNELFELFRNKFTYQEFLKNI